MEEIRLQKYLANNGIASRRKCEELIIQGRVKVNGEVVTELGTKINPDKDIIEYNGVFLFCNQNRMIDTSQCELPLNPRLAGGEGEESCRNTVSKQFMKIT